MATNNILKDLFAQIIHSEEKVKERTARLKKVNNEIEKFQAKITETWDEIKSFQGNVVIKSQTIAEQELQLKWFSEKQKILTEQKQNLEKHKTDLQSSLKRIHDDTDNERELFLEKAKQFCSLYDLVSDGRKKREINRKRKLEEIIKYKEKLKAEIEDIKKANKEVNFLEGKKKKILSQINELEAKHQGIDSLINEKRKETERMEMEKIKVSQKSQSDPEFQRISAEFRSCKENSLSLEGVCDAMNQELRELQQQYYQKQLQKQRKQRQEQKQQQKDQWQQEQKEQWYQQQQQKKQQWPTQQQQRQQGQNQPPLPKQWPHQSFQEKRIQRPLFDTNAQKQQRQDISNGDTSHSRVQPHPKQSSFHY